jgi:hypothetical protein
MTPTDDARPEGTALPDGTPKRSRAKLLRTGLMVVALVLCVVFLIPRADDIVTAVGQQSALSIVGALLLGFAGIYATFLSWRELMKGAGHRLPWAASQRVFFLSQIGKYIPGSIWPIVAQADLGRAHKVPPTRSVAVGLLTLLISCGAGICMAAATLPFVTPDALADYWFVLILVPIVLLPLYPPILRSLMRLASKVARRDLADLSLRGRNTVAAWLWAAVAWVLFGGQIAVLLTPLKTLSPSTVLLSIGAYALAWLVGFLVFFLPAGLGGREAVLTALLVVGGAATSGQGVSIALMSRVLLTVGDLVLAGSAILNHRLREGRGAEVTTPESLRS